MKRAITPAITARLGGNESAPRIPTKANSTARATRTIPMTKKKLPSIPPRILPRVPHAASARRSTLRTAS